MIILYLAIFLFIGYLFLIAFYWIGWRSIPESSLLTQNFGSRVSLIIPARNEEENIGQLLNALRIQTYPRDLVEIIVVNDHSTDRTAEIIARFHEVRSIELNDDEINSYKKKAIEEGIKAASGELIVTTDADCIPQPRWLEVLVSFYLENESVFIAAPVAYKCNSSLLEIFQALDFLSLQGITAASVHKQIHSMSNGANLAYTKAAFNKVDGFAGVDNIASGDDMLLMHKIWKQFPGKVHYLKSREAIVYTRPMKTWKEFFNQRIRWASKARFYDDRRILPVLTLVYLFNLSFFALFVGGFWLHILWLYLVLLWIGKTLIEIPFAWSVSGFFGQRSLLKYFFFFQPLHIAYTILAGLLGQFGKYEWKGRRVR